METAKVEAIQQANKAKDLRKFNDICAKAAKPPGIKLLNRDRLLAALFLGNAYSEAKAKGVLTSKDDLEGCIFNRMSRKQDKSEQFRLNRWILPKRITEITKPVEDDYKGKREPHKALITYLDAIAELASRNGTDPKESQLDLLSRLSVWRRNSSYDPGEDRLIPALNLSNLLDRLCKKLSTDNKLPELFDRIRSLPCDWNPYSECLVLCDRKNMGSGKSPVSPEFEEVVLPNEMFPFPSVPLIRIPYLIHDAKIEVTGASDATAVDSATDVRIRTVKVIYYREIRLTIAPLSPSEMGAVFQTRGVIEVPEAYLWKPTEHLTLQEALQYLQTASRRKYLGERLPIQPIRMIAPRQTSVRPEVLLDGQWYSLLGDTELFELEGHKYISRMGTAYDFDHDPVGQPRSWHGTSMFVFSYTPATAPYVYHWLAQRHILQDAGLLHLSDGGEEISLWRRSEMDAHRLEFPYLNLPDDVAALDARYGQNLPDQFALNFPDSALSGSDVEKCLHNGLIEAALQNKIDLLRQQVKEMEEVWHSGREDATNALLKRYHITQTKA